MSIPRPRISLLTLMMLMTIAAMGVALWQQYLRYNPLEAELRKLRDEVGQLTIEDDTKPHAIEVETGELNHWRWRVFIPDQGKYGIHCYGDYVPATGIPQNKGSGGWHSLSPGEYRFDLSLVPGYPEAKRKVLKVRLTDQNGANTNFSLYETKHQWISGEQGTSFTWQSVGKKTEFFDTDEAMVLLRLRAQTRKVVGTDTDGKPNRWRSEDVAEPCEGLMIWVDQKNP